MRALICLLMMCGSSCQLMSYFEIAPCELGAESWQECGPCGAGRILMVCNSSYDWEPADDEGCTHNPYDLDGDGVPNEVCRFEAGDCCGASTDCDDEDPTRWSGHADLDGDGHDAESCGGDDCDDQDDDRWTGHADFDGDGHDTASCGGDDCDDDDPLRWTGRADLDLDGRDSLSCGGDDCDDEDPTRWGDPEDLDGWRAGADLDNDGHVAESCGGDDCNDADPLRWTGHADLDQDGYVHRRCGGDDCDDDCPTCYPGALEICGDARDHDCDGVVDDSGDCATCFPTGWFAYRPWDFGPSRDIFVSGLYAYVAGDNGLYVVQIESISYVGFVATGPLNAVWVWGDHAFVGSENDGLRVIDVSEPSSPRYIDHDQIPTGSPRDLVVSNGYAYVAADSGLFIVDVLEPTNPELIAGPVIEPGFEPVTSVAVLGDHVVLGSRGMLIVDVSEPTVPIVVGGLRSFAFDLMPTSMAIADDFAFVSSPTPSPGLYVVELTNPSNPELVAGPVPMTVLSRDVFVSSGFVYLAGEDGLYLVDVRQPRHPIALWGASIDSLPAGHFGLPRALFGAQVPSTDGHALFLATDLGMTAIFLNCGCVEGPENTEEACSDGCSNDYDWPTDCNDPDCGCTLVCGGTGCGVECAEGPENSDEACSDSCDNDTDGYIDCDDWSCACAETCGGPGCDACIEGSENSEASCSDGCDNDGDGAHDCHDFDCECSIYCGALGCVDCPEGPEQSEETCSDDCNNDRDGWIDCSDWDCGCAVVCGGPGCGGTL